MNYKNAKTKEIVAALATTWTTRKGWGSRVEVSCYHEECSQWQTGKCPSKVNPSLTLSPLVI